MSLAIGWAFIVCLRADINGPPTRRGPSTADRIGAQFGAVVCFEATDGQEWRLWAALDGAGMEARQLPPAHIKAFAASRGTRAKTDRIDAKLSARHLAFRPDV